MNEKSSWSAEDILELARAYQGAAVLQAAGELDIFTALAQGAADVPALARSLEADERGLLVLLDALVAMGLLKKSSARYALAAGLDQLLTPSGKGTVLAMVQHQAHCLRNWAQLARVVKTNSPAGCEPGVRGEAGEREAFIGAMDNISAPQADRAIRGVQPLQFEHLLDVGGASGTWTLAFLRACPSARATLFDLPPVIPLAQARLQTAGASSRVELVAGDFMRDRLPGGADLAWVSAIVHQNSRAQNRELFKNVFQALRPGGRIAIRDIVMESNRTAPAAGALFAINMLVATEGGGTFTFDELRSDLESVGFEHAGLVRQEPPMNSIVTATRRG
jgi:precorrin-6B methylase 2